LNTHALPRLYFGAPLIVTERTADNFLSLIPTDELGLNMQKRTDGFVRNDIFPILKKDGQPVKLLKDAQTFTDAWVTFIRNVFKRTADGRVEPTTIIKVASQGDNGVYDITSNKKQQQEIRDQTRQAVIKKNLINAERQLDELRLRRLAERIQDPNGFTSAENARINAATKTRLKRNLTNSAEENRYNDGWQPDMYQHPGMQRPR
jgi:hypothetical protein